MTELVTTFLVSVSVAGVDSLKHYICKWLDRQVGKSNSLNGVVHCDE